MRLQGSTRVSTPHVEFKTAALNLTYRGRNCWAGRTAEEVPNLKWCMHAQFCNRLRFAWSSSEMPNPAKQVGKCRKISQEQQNIDRVYQQLNQQVIQQELCEDSWTTTNNCTTTRWRVASLQSTFSCSNMPLAGPSRPGEEKGNAPELFFRSTCYISLSM